jgi:hypothetical protein
MEPIHTTPFFINRKIQDTKRAHTKTACRMVNWLFHLNTEFFREPKQREQPINRAKPYEENIGRRHVSYRLSPNGTVEVAVATTDTPFRIERDEDVSALFAFLGQVRDRFLYHLIK